MARVLLVDDDRELCSLLEEYLTSEGHEPQSHHEGSAAAELACSGQFDVVVLDVMLPGLGGLDVLRQIREASEIPVLILSARGEEVDRIVGLELGADDYLAKPFNPRELAARLRAILRRTSDSNANCDTLQLGDLIVDTGSRSVQRGGETIEVTGVEFELLRLLLARAGEVVTRNELGLHALGRRPSAYDRALDVHISNLRRKLGPGPEGDERLKTVRGVGYQYIRPRLTDA